MLLGAFVNVIAFGRVIRPDPEARVARALIAKRLVFADLRASKGIFAFVDVATCFI